MTSGSQRLRLPYLLMSIVLLQACGPKSTVAPDFASRNVQRLAVLPTIAPMTVREERVGYFDASLAAELEAAGFELLDPTLVRNTCSVPACPERRRLSTRYDLDGFVQTEITSSSSNNFGIGFYNQLSGTLQLHSADDSELASIAYTESKRGGLVFQSGQIIEGIQETFENVGDTSFNTLADKFARTVVQELPEARSRLLDPAVASSPNSEDSARDTAGDYRSNVLAEITTTRVASRAFEVCARGTPNRSAYLLTSRHRSNLREVGSGLYCGRFALYPNSGPLMVELRSAFGSSVREPLALDLGEHAQHSGATTARDTPEYSANEENRTLATQTPTAIIR
ncbi:MAG: hypothetical protein KDD69_11560 [Bdellovibrionales bacterium]|nr:hypothetical protein [Bdellovibrionales bacterium]